MRMDNSALRQDKEMTERGVCLEELYGGYFGSQENCRYFLPHLHPSLFSNVQPVIIDAGSSQGVLGAYVRGVFQERGCQPELILIDNNAAALQNSPVEAKKIVGNLLDIPLDDESAQLVLLRSVMHYMSWDDQEKLFEEVHRILASGGMLISQFASFYSARQALTFNELFPLFGRKVYFHTRVHGIQFHQQLFPYLWGIAEGPTLYERLNEFAHRIGVTDTTEAVQYLEKHKAELGDVLTSSERPYRWQIPYTIISCWK